MELESDSNGGYCNRCRSWHGLPWKAAWASCQKLMADLRHHDRIDFMRPVAQADPLYRTAPLFTGGSGKMLGLLLCRDAHGVEHRLLAFSGMFNGLWLADGWVPPVFDVQAFLRLHVPVERQIKELGAQIAGLPPSAPERRELITERRELSRHNMVVIHKLYQLRNFRGDTQPLTSFFPPQSGPPAGAGDCCGPKLLHQAQRLGLWPLSMAEFYWGGNNASASKEHGRRYPPCTSKCRPILGFQLCGL